MLVKDTIAKWNTLCTIKEYKENPEFYKNKLPEDGGLYSIICEDPTKLTFTDPNADDQHIKHFGKDYLTLKNKHHNSNIIYIGKANASNTIRNRINQYMVAGGHKGGRAIWQINESDNLIIKYNVYQNPESVEHKLLSNFADEQKMNKINMSRKFYYPLANQKS